jgi:hypothetical protein
MTSSSDLVPISGALTRAQLAGLRTLSGRTRTPVAVLIRQAVDALLAEKAAPAPNAARRRTV